MSRLFLLTCVFPAAFATACLAQSQKLPSELAGLPDEIKTLKWPAIDMGQVSTLERCRALMLLNNTLDELSANAAAEAELMSAYVEKNNLGAQFAGTAPPPAPPALSFADAEKVAVALLRGPMRTSSYASNLAGLGAGALESYEQMYARTCARRWSEFDESRHLVRCMSSFLGKAKKLPDYDAWATAESARREAAAQQRAAAAPSAAAARAQQDQKQEAQLREQQLELQQMSAALAAAHAQQRQQQQQPQVASGQQPSGDQTLTPAGQPAQAMNGGYVVDDATAYGAYGGYGGYGYYGARVAPGAAAAAGAYAGANAAQYHGANATWNRESTYNSDARAQTEARMTSFHGAGGRR
jgi:hypothetical protein